MTVIYNIFFKGIFSQFDLQSKKKIEASMPLKTESSTCHEQQSVKQNVAR